MSAARVPFPFASVPRAVFVAARDGRLSPNAAWVLACLYHAANVFTWTASFRDLDAIARLVAWHASPDFLSKTLRRLRTDGWIAFDSKPGRTHHGYVISLLHGPAKRSEQGPSSDEQAGPSSDDAETSTAPWDGAAAEPEGSEQQEPAIPPVDPSGGHHGPSSDTAETQDAEPVSDASESETVRASRNTLRQDLALTKRRVLGSESSRFTPKTWPCEKCERNSECEQCLRARLGAKEARA